MHGTVEAPKAIEQLICNALSEGLEVTVGLELPRVDQQAIDLFLDSENLESARNMVLGLNFWARQYQDGRASQAMLQLLEAMRLLKLSGKPVNVILIDKPSSSDRDFEMADRILTEVQKRPSNFFAVLTGNLHNRVNPGGTRMGTRVLAELGKGKVVSLRQSYAGGSAWVCLSGEGCGVHKLGGRGTGEVGISFDPALPDYDGIYEMDSIHGSRPARELHLTKN